MAKVRDRIGNRPLYISVDIDVLDPAHAPGTGTPEAGGITSRELLEIIRGFRGMNLIGADIVEVAPAYDHAEITGVAGQPCCLRTGHPDGGQRRGGGPLRGAERLCGAGPGPRNRAGPPASQPRARIR